MSGNFLFPICYYVLFKKKVIILKINNEKAMKLGTRLLNEHSNPVFVGFVQFFL